MDGGVAINLGGRCLENPALEALGKAQHVDGPVHARLCRLHRIVLIMDGRGRAGEVIDFVHLDIERKGHIVPQELKAGIADQMLDIPLGAGEEIVGAEHIVSVGDQPLAEMRAEEACPACDEDCLCLLHVPIPAFTRSYRGLISPPASLHLSKRKLLISLSQPRLR